MKPCDWTIIAHSMLGAGYGVEDIAIKATALGMRTTPDMVRNEVSRLRSEGWLMEVLFPMWRESHGIRKDERSGDHQQEKQAEASDPI